MDTEGKYKTLTDFIKKGPKQWTNLSDKGYILECWKNELTELVDSLENPLPEKDETNET